MTYGQAGQISNWLLLVYPDANKEQGATGGGEPTAEAEDDEKMEQATAAKVEQQLQENLADPLDVVTVKVCDEDEDEEQDEEDEEDEDYDTEEDDYLRNFINKESQVGTSLGGPTRSTWAKQVKICFTCISFYRSSRRLIAHRGVQQASGITLKLMAWMRGRLSNKQVSFYAKWVTVTL